MQKNKCPFCSPGKVDMLMISPTVLPSISEQSSTTFDTFFDTSNSFTASSQPSPSQSAILMCTRFSAVSSWLSNQLKSSSRESDIACSTVVDPWCIINFPSFNFGLQSKDRVPQSKSPFTPPSGCVFDHWSTGSADCLSCFSSVRRGGGGETYVEFLRPNKSSPHRVP